MLKLNCFFVLMLITFSVSANWWDVEWAKNADLEIEIRSETEDGDLIIREIFYTTHEWKGEKIRIAGHLAIPKTATETDQLPGWIDMTGDLNSAKNYARQANVVALSTDRVGSGDSTGPADNYVEWLKLDQDAKDGWMYHFVMSAIRGVTFLQSLPIVDPDAIGITGVSRGGICSLLANSIDPRIKLAVPIAATGDMITTSKFDDNWIVSIFLAEGGKTVEDDAFFIFNKRYDPVNTVQNSHGAVFLINGSQDEFFPLTATKNVFEKISSEKRIDIIYDCDHGYYGREDGLHDSYNNGIEIFRRMANCPKKAIDVYLHGNGVMPETPTVSMIELDPKTVRFEVKADDRDEIRAIYINYSRDNAWTFEREKIKSGSIDINITKNELSQIAYFAEIEYESGYFLTSVPKFGKTFTPRIRPKP